MEIDDSIDRIVAAGYDRRQFDAPRLERWLIRGSAEREAFFPGQTAVDPAFEQRDFLFRKPLLCSVMLVDGLFADGRVIGSL